MLNIYAERYEPIGTPGAPETAYRVVVLFRVVGRDGNSGGTTGAFSKPLVPMCAYVKLRVSGTRGFFVFLMNRSDLKKLAEMRLSDAKALLKTRRNNAGAYYIAGYAVECALKACIAKNQGQYPFPDFIKENDLRSKYYTHSLEILIKTGDLEGKLSIERGKNADFDRNWRLVSTTWDETYRYQPTILRTEVEDLIQAIDDPRNGVLAWLKQHW